MLKILLIGTIVAILVGPLVLQETSRLAYATPSLVINPTIGPAGASVTYTVTGETPNTHYNILGGASPVTGTTDANGGASGTVIAPSSSTMFIFDDGNPNDKISADFTVTSGSASVSGDVNIAGTCGISLGAGNPIHYGSLTPGQTSGNQLLQLTNTGTVAASLFTQGTDWLDGSSNSQMTVDNTKWSMTPGPYTSATALSQSPVMMTNSFATGSPTSTYWQLQIHLANQNFVGSLTQTTTFSVSC